MATSPVARGLGPLETLVNVAWADPCIITIFADGRYPDETLPGGLSAVLTLTELGKQHGGEIIFQRLTHGTVIGGRSWFQATLRFTRAPSFVKPGLPEVFELALSGAKPQVDPGSPGDVQDPFCGLSTFTASRGAIYICGGPFISPGTVSHLDGSKDDVIKVYRMCQIVSMNITTPAGSDGTSYETGVGVPVEAAGSGAESNTRSWESIWYRDSNGNPHNTGFPCSMLPLFQPGGGNLPTANSTLRGWQLVQVDVYGKGTSAKPLAEQPDDMTQVNTKPDAQFPSWMFRMEIGPSLAGLNSDFRPVFDDLPDGTYPIGLRKMYFSNAPQYKPGRDYQTYVVYPLGPGGVKYNYKIKTPLNTEYSPPLVPIPNTIPANEFFEETLYPVGVLPPYNDLIAIRP